MKPSSLMIVSLVVGCNSSKQDIDDSRCAYPMTLCTIAGTGTGGYNGGGDSDPPVNVTETQLRDPTAIVEDPDGRLIVSDAGNYLIRRLEDNRLMNVVGRNANSAATSGDASTTTLSFVVDMDFGADGRLGILEGVGRQLSWVDLEVGELTVHASAALESQEGWNRAEVTALEEIKLTKPSSTAIDGDGNIYLADAGEDVNMILKITPDGSVTKVAGVGEDGYPVAATPSNPEADHYRFLSPQGLLWHEGALYVADSGRHRIVRVDVDTGEVVNVAGITDAPGYGDGGALLDTKFERPTHFAFGWDGRLVISDSGNGVIRAELMDGTVETICGRGVGGYDNEPQDPEGASLGEPFDLLFDINGDLVFTDRNHAVVRRITQPDW